MSPHPASGTPGTPVVFANLEAGSYTIRVLAVATETGEKEDSTRPLYIPASSNDCVGNLINHGVSDSEDQGGVVAEFKVSGKYAFLNCKLDGVLLQRQLCKSVAFSEIGTYCTRCPSTQFSSSGLHIALHSFFCLLAYCIESVV